MKGLSLIPGMPATCKGGPAKQAQAAPHEGATRGFALGWLPSRGHRGNMAIQSFGIGWCILPVIADTGAQKGSRVPTRGTAGREVGRSVKAGSVRSG